MRRMRAGARRVVIVGIYWVRVRRDDRMTRTGTLTLPPATESTNIVK